VSLLPGHWQNVLDIRGYFGDLRCLSDQVRANEGKHRKKEPSGAKVGNEDGKEGENKVAESA